MKQVNSPPLLPRKGIKVMQHQQLVSKSREKQLAESQLRSVRSSQTRGISRSRESGINLDRIYQAKHFLPPKPARKEQQKPREETRTLISYKSQQLLTSKEETASKRQENNEEIKIRTTKDLEAMVDSRNSEMDKGSLLVNERSQQKDHNVKIIRRGNPQKVQPNIIAF